MDGYLSKKPKTHEEKILIHQFSQAYAIPPFIVASKMLRAIKHAGFNSCIMIDKTKTVLTSSRKFEQLAKLTQGISLLAKSVPIPAFQAIYRNNLALRLGSEGLQRGIFSYYIHIGEKHK